jgi:hypothetical protein
MKTPEEMKSTIGKLTSPEIDRLKSMKKDIEYILDNPKVSEDSLEKMMSISVEVQAFCEIYTRKIIAMLKQNHMI